MSAADRPYFRTLWQFLQSVVRHGVDRDHRVLVYDLGLDEAQQALLRRQFARVEWRRFAFDRYPAFMRGTRMAHERRPCKPVLGHYGWKPAIVAEVLEEARGAVLWLDSATLLHGSLEPVVRALEASGTYVPYSGTATLGERTHPETLRQLDVPPHLLGRRQRGSGVCAFDYRRGAARELVEAWRALGSDEAILAPPGADLNSHNYDQSLLTALLYMYEDSGRLRLTEDEQDISSAHPVDFLSVRNKVSNRVPLWADPLARAWFRCRRWVDVRVVRARCGGDSGPHVAAPEPP